MIIFLEPNLKDLPGFEERGFGISDQYAVYLTHYTAENMSEFLGKVIEAGVQGSNAVTVGHFCWS